MLIFNNPVKLSLLCGILFLFLTGCSKTEKWETYSANNTQTGNGEFEKNLPADFQLPTDNVGKKLLKEYGALFVAKGDAVVPKTVIFKDEAAVSQFQAGLKTSTEKIGAYNIELQTAAINALKEASEEAKKSGLTITSRAEDSGKRTYNTTVELWKSRVNPGLEHWVKQGKLPKSDADRIRNLSPFEQVTEILTLEEKGMFFSKDLSKSIIYSVAPPGTSQHLSLLALDINEHENAKVREILAKHGWFQTVVSDLPHFTFLGVKQEELTNLGLKKISDGGRNFWIPAM